MADVTVARAQRDQVPTTPTVTSEEKAAASFPALSRLLIVLWMGLVLGTAGFLLFGSLRIGAGNRIGRRMEVREIWSRFVEFLVDQGAPAPLLVAVTAAAGVALIAAALALWLAFGLRDTYQDPPVDESAGM